MRNVFHQIERKFSEVKFSIQAENFQTMSVQFDGNGMCGTQEGKEHIFRLLSFIENIP